MKKELVLMSMEDKLAILMLNNVPNNLLNDKFLDAIEKKLILSKNKGARTILISTKLKHFSAGADPKFLIMWRRSIAHVPQNIFLIDNSIEENIALGVDPIDLNLDKVKLSAKKAQI